jgi:tetratricopeptide (TPR) repeat protein
MRRIAALGVATALVTSTALAQHEHHGNAETVGRVSFPSSCAAPVQPKLDLAVAMLHSFWFAEAATAFSAIAAEDSTCAMAHWGTAMTMWGNPFARLPITGERQATGLAAAERATELAQRASHREQMYAAAALALWRDADTQDHLARLGRHEAAMEKLYAAHREDPEAAIFYARSVIANAPPSDLTFARQKFAATILEPLFEQQPLHPGLAHYTIHTFDSPALAQHGLAAARRYAKIAPAAPHALHMPSHIFTRLGLWDESIETNRRSANAEPDSNAAVHPNDYMVYAYLQQGRDADAERVVRRSRERNDRFYGGVLGYNAIAMQARYALERGAWAEATTVQVPQSGAPFIAAVARFARAIGAARSGNSASAKAEVAALATLRDSLKAHGDTYWTTIVEAQRLAASAWIATAKGRHDEAMRLAREGADLEETVEKHPVTPGPLLPARELQGDLLMALGRHAEALEAYERTLTREPNRARALYGAARAAERSGNASLARTHYESLATLMANADTSREEARAAKAYLGRSG